MTSTSIWRLLWRWRKVCSSSAHNIDAEEVMGMYSAAQGNAPNATLNYISALIRSRQNKIYKFIESNDKEMTKKNVLQRYVNEMKKLWRESVINVKREIYKKLIKLKQILD